MLKTVEGDGKRDGIVDDNKKGEGAGECGGGSHAPVHQASPGERFGTNSAGRMEKYEMAHDKLNKGEDRYCSSRLCLIYLSQDMGGTRSA